MVRASVLLYCGLIVTRDQHSMPSGVCIYECTMRRIRRGRGRERAPQFAVAYIVQHQSALIASLHITSDIHDEMVFEVKEIDDQNVKSFALASIQKIGKQLLNARHTKKIY